MNTLPEVDEAKQVMREAIDWSVVRWLREKKRVRRIADRANEALDRVSADVRARWSADLLAAYRALGDGKPPAGAAHGIVENARRSRLADEEAERAHLDAEATFDQAEKQLSARVAREGCQKAIVSWQLHERAIEIAAKYLAQR